MPVRLIGPSRLVTAVSPEEEPPSAAIGPMLASLLKGPLSSYSIALAPTAAQSPAPSPLGCVAPLTVPSLVCPWLALVDLWASAGIAGGPPLASRRSDLLLLGSATTARLRTATATLKDLVAFLAAAVLRRALMAAPLRWPCGAGFPGSCRRNGFICLTWELEAVSRCLDLPLGPPTMTRSVALLAMRRLTMLQMGVVPLEQPPV